MIPITYSFLLTCIYILLNSIIDTTELVFMPPTDWCFMIIFDCNMFVNHCLINLFLNHFNKLELLLAKSNNFIIPDDFFIYQSNFLWCQRHTSIDQKKKKDTSKQSNGWRWKWVLSSYFISRTYNIHLYWSAGKNPPHEN